MLAQGAFFLGGFLAVLGFIVAKGMRHHGGASGMIICVYGFVVILAALFSPMDAGGSVNLGLALDRICYLLAGGFLMLLGGICYAAHKIPERIKAAAILELNQPAPTMRDPVKIQSA